MDYQLDGGGPNQAGSCADETERQISAAFAALADVPEDTFWEAMATIQPDCGSPEDLRSLQTRGFAVVRQFLSREILDRVTAKFPPMDELSEGPARFASHGLPREALDATLAAKLEGLLMSWHMDRLLPPSQNISKPVIGGFLYIRTDPKAPRSFCPEPCLGRWHVDPSPGCPRFPKVSMMVHRDAASSWEHGNILLAPTRSLLQLHQQTQRFNATRAVCDSRRDAPDAACAVHPWRNGLQARALAEASMATSTTGSRTEQGCNRQSSHYCRREAALERIGCLVSLAPGDLLFFSGDLYHRTQNSASARITLQATVAAVGT